MFDDNSGGGDVDSSPAANVVGWQVTPVDLHKTQGSPVRELVHSFLRAAVKEQRDMSRVSVLLHISQKTTHQRTVVMVSIEDQCGILALQALERNAETLSRNTFHVVVSCCQGRQSC